MNTRWQQVWVEVDESEEFSNYRMRVEQLTWELEALRTNLAEKEELLPALRLTDAAVLKCIAWTAGSIVPGRLAHPVF